MHARFSLTAAALAALTALAGCSDTPSDMDTGTPMPDAAVTFPPTPVLSVGTTSNPTRDAASFGCIGGASGPMPSADVTYSFQLRGFGSGDAVRDTDVWFFPDNVLRESCTGTCQEFTTDAMGNAMVTSPANGWYAYRVFFHMGGSMASTYVDSVQINEPAPGPSGGSVEGSAVSTATLNLIPAAITGVPRPAGTALIAGEIRDCDNNPVRGGFIRIFSEGNEIVSNWEDGTAPQMRYFDGEENPDDRSTYTQVDGLFASINLPAPEAGIAPLRIEGWGVLNEGGPTQRLGCEEVGVYADGVSIVNVLPLRSDYPAGHPCAD